MFRPYLVSAVLRSMIRCRRARRGRKVSRCVHHLRGGWFFCFLAAAMGPSHGKTVRSATYENCVTSSPLPVLRVAAQQSEVLSLPTKTKLSVREKGQERSLIELENGILLYVATEKLVDACPTSRHVLTNETEQPVTLIRTDADDVALSQTKIDTRKSSEPVEKNGNASTAQATCKSTAEVHRRIAIYPLESDGVPGNLAAIVSEHLLAEVRKLDQVSAIGLDEIREMMDFEAERMTLGCSNDECLNEIAGALGVDEIITGSLRADVTGRHLHLKRIDQRRAQVVHSVNRILVPAAGEEYLLALGPAVAALFPARALRPGTKRGVSSRAVLRLNPPPISPWVTWTALGGTTSLTAVAGALFTSTYFAKSSAEELSHKTERVPIAALELQQAREQPALLGQASVSVALGALGLAVATGMLALFTDWEVDGDQL